MITLLDSGEKLLHIRAQIASTLRKAITELPAASPERAELVALLVAENNAKLELALSLALELEDRRYEI